MKRRDFLKLAAVSPLVGFVIPKNDQTKADMTLNNAIERSDFIDRILKARDEYFLRMGVRRISY